MSRQSIPVLNRERTVPVGTMLTVPGQSLEHWQLLATSANGKYFLMRRINVIGQEFKPTNDWATVPVHRVDPKDMMIESSFWLAVFPHITLTVQ